MESSRGIDINSVSWQQALSGLDAVRDKQTKKTVLLHVIQQLGEAIKAGLEPQKMGLMVWAALKAARPLAPEDYTDVVSAIVSDIALFTPDGAQAYHASGWEVLEGATRVYVRGDELVNSHFWPLLEQRLTDEISSVVVQGPGEDIELTSAIAKEMIKEKPGPECLLHSVYCKFGDGSDALELPESLMRVVFPALKDSFSGAFVREGTVDKPLHLDMSVEHLPLVRRYIESSPRPTVKELSGAETAVLLDVLDYGGNADLKNELHGQLQERFSENDRNFTIDNFVWFGELYANTQQSEHRARLEDYFGSALINSVFKARRLSNPKQRFPSLKAIAAGAERVTATSVPLEKIPKPESFEQIIDVLNQINLSRLVIRGKGPPWFWEGIKTLQGVAEICFLTTQTLQSELCLETLKDMHPRPKLLFKDQAALEEAQKIAPDFQLGVR